MFGTGAARARNLLAKRLTPAEHTNGGIAAREACALRHEHLVSSGTLAAWGDSAVGALLPSLFPHAEHGARTHVYFEPPQRSSPSCFSVSF
jgi:hypothetical protein